MAENDKREGEGAGFKVVDRRSSSQPAEERAEPSAEPTEAPPRESRPELPPMSFSTFVVSLASSAAFHLGDAPHPETGQVGRDLPLAKQTIDILGMLQEKTRGNLNADEQRLLETVLYDLRLRFVEVSRVGV